MNYIDIIIFAVILIGFALGFKDGLVRKIIGIIGFITAIVLAFKFGKPLGEYVLPLFNDELYLAEIISGIVIFFVVILIVSLLKRVIHPLDKVNRFVNQLLGGISGAIQIIFFISAFLLFLNIFDFPKNEDRKNSLLYEGIFKVVPYTVDFISGENFKTDEIIKNILDKESDYRNIEDTTKIN